MADGETIATRKEAIAQWRLLELLRERLLADMLERNGTNRELERLSAEVATKRVDPYSAVDELINRKEQ